MKAIELVVRGVEDYDGGLSGRWRIIFDNASIVMISKEDCTAAPQLGDKFMLMPIYGVGFTQAHHAEGVAGATAAVDAVAAKWEGTNVERRAGLDMVGEAEQAPTD